MNSKKTLKLLNSFSDEDKKCLEDMKKQMNKAEKQIGEIVVQIQNLTESVNTIQKKIDSRIEINPMDEYYPINNRLDVLECDTDIPKTKEEHQINNIAREEEISSGKRKAKRYKENTKEEKQMVKREYKKETKSESIKTVNEKKKKSKFGIIGEFAFYLLLIVMVLGAFLLRSNSSGQPTSFAGFSLFTVLTGSMESEIPKGSLVLTQNVDPKTLQIGDDITFMASKTTTITHRIIAIMESYQNTGARAFQTQGIMNDEPDKNMVPAVNVVGKVVWHSKVFGDIANFLGQNLIFLIFVVAVLIIFFNVMKRVFKEEGKPNIEQNTQEEHINKRRLRKGKREK